MKNSKTVPPKEVIPLAVVLDVLEFDYGLDVKCPNCKRWSAKFFNIEGSYALRCCGCQKHVGDCRCKTMGQIMAELTYRREICTILDNIS